MSVVTPTQIILHQQSKVLEIHYDDGRRDELSFEFLRVHSPSAEVRGHGPGQEVLQIGKQDVTITDVRPVGNYGICPTFSDGHNTGIYTWDYLYGLGSNRDQPWRDYLQRLEQAGHHRSPHA